jgi:hypothetical protein
MDSNNGNGVPVIEITANHIYLIILGNRKIIQSLTADLNKKTTPDVSYHMTKMITPLAQECNEIIVPKVMNGKKTFNGSVYIQIVEGAEIAQCYICAHGKEYHENLYMLTSLESESSFGFPKFDLDNESDPEKIIVGWFTKNNCTVPKGIKKNMEPITVVGNDNDILVVACIIG